MNPVAIVRRLGEEGFRIFKTEDFRKIAIELGLKDSYVPQLIRRLIKDGSLISLYRGTYTIAGGLLAGPPLSSYEIGLALAKPSALCCWTAFSLHNLTDQVLRAVFVMTTYQREHNSVKTNFEIQGARYKIIRVQEKFFYGYERRFLTEVPIIVTDLERTLIDGLVRPQYCGGFREVIEGFRLGWDRVNVDKLIDYGHKMSTAVLKRIGMVCETLELENPRLEELQSIPCSSFYKLDTSGENKGPWNYRWNLRDNVS